MLLTGNINAKAVQAKAPVRFINKPNLGTTVANRPVMRTMKVLFIMFFMYGLLLNGFGLVLKKPACSVMSIAGIT